MSTRCNIVIEFGDTVLYVYRHYDGYLRDTGRDLVDLLKEEGKTPWRFISELLAKRYGKQPYESEPRPIYEVVDSIHGDIEYLYRIKFLSDARGTSFIIGYAGCPYTSQDHLIPAIKNVTVGSIEAFESEIANELFF